MDETVDSFLKEINKIVPPHAIWEECYDEKSGFAYYWNTKTDDVTWEAPEGFQKQPGKNQNCPKKLFIPPPYEKKSMLDSLPRVNQADVKIYKIDDGKKAPPAPAKKDNKNNSEKNIKKKPFPRKPSSESEDEKIVLISSYGTDSSDEETNVPEINQEDTKVEPASPVPQEKDDIKESPVEKTQESSPYNSEDETDILTQIQTKAKMLKQMGGELPEEVKRLVTDTNDDKSKEVTGFSLVAGYGNDSEEESDSEEQQDKILFPIKITKPVSTLFPISNAPSPVLSNEADPIDKPIIVPEENVDVKAFQRKRRIGVSLVNVPKRPIPEQDKTADKERPGFGFKGGTTKDYPGFTSGGVLFWPASEDVQSVVENEDDFVKASDEKLLRDIKEFHATLSEKLKFLCEGHNPALPVQIMIIQMETLYAALKHKCLKPRYLQKWLDNTCQDLSELETEAAPAGWLLQWDRTHKRYYYRNETSGENQWEYPQPDIVSVDEAMDISTTPPPPVVAEEPPPPLESMNMVLPPPPPQIKEKSISPPPPPIISDYQLKENLNNEEPYPPGVDAPELERNKEYTGKDTFASELNSFYSDIATMETSHNPPNEPHANKAMPGENPQGLEDVPAKKKRKVKISQGLSMKKKGVSKLVEKWKNVQKTY